MAKFPIYNHRTGEVLFVATIKKSNSPSYEGYNVAMAMYWALENGVSLKDADLRSAGLRHYVDLAEFDLRGALLPDTHVKIPKIHQTVYKVASEPGALNMGEWHCGSSHCRAGWVVTLAGKAGRELEEKYGTPAAAGLIYLASDPDFGRVPDFYCSNEEALEDMATMAALEAEKDSDGPLIKEET